METSIYNFSDISGIGHTVSYIYNTQSDSYRIYMSNEEIKCIYHKPWHSSMYLQEKEIMFALNNFDEVSLDYYIKNEFKNYFPYLVTVRNRQNNKLTDIEYENIHTQYHHNMVFDKELLDKFSSYWDTQPKYDFYETIQKYVYDSEIDSEVHFMIQNNMAKLIEFGDYKILFTPDTQKMLYYYDAIKNNHNSEYNKSNLDALLKEEFIKKEDQEKYLDDDQKILFRQKLSDLFDKYHNKTKNIRLRYQIFIFNKTKNSRQIKHLYQLTPEDKPLLEHIIVEFKEFIKTHPYFGKYIITDNIVFYHQFPSQHLKNVFYIMTEYLYPCEELKYFGYKQDMIFNLNEIIENLGNNIPISGKFVNPDAEELKIYDEHINEYLRNLPNIRININNLEEAKKEIDQNWKSYDYETKKHILSRILKYIDYKLNPVIPFIKNKPDCYNKCYEEKKFIYGYDFDKYLSDNPNRFNIYNMCLKYPQCIFLDGRIIGQNIEQYRELYEKIKNKEQLTNEQKDIFINYELNNLTIRKIINKLNELEIPAKETIINNISKIRKDFLVYIAYLCFQTNKLEQLIDWFNWLAIIYGDIKILFSASTSIKYHYINCYFGNDTNNLYQITFKPKQMKCSLMTNAYYMKYIPIMTSGNYSHYRGFNVSDYSNYFGYDIVMEKINIPENLNKLFTNNIVFYKNIIINDFKERIIKYTDFINKLISDKKIELYEFFLKSLFGDVNLIRSIIEISPTIEEFIKIWSQFFNFSSDGNYIIIPDKKWIDRNNFYTKNDIKKIIEGGDIYLTSWIIPEYCKKYYSLKEYNNIMCYDWIYIIYNSQDRLTKYDEIMKKIDYDRIQIIEIIKNIEEDNFSHTISDIKTNEQKENLMNVIYDVIRIMKKNINKNININDITFIVHPFPDLETSLLLHIHNIYDNDSKKNIYTLGNISYYEIFKRRFGASINVISYIMGLKLSNIYPIRPDIKIFYG